MNKSVTLLELIIVIVIIGILATLGLSGYPRWLERHRGREGETNLELIYHAEKRFGLDHRGNYFVCAPCTMQIINTGLDIETTGACFTYTIATGTTGTRTSFIATATRTGPGPCAGSQMTITQDDGPVNKAGCNVW